MKTLQIVTIHFILISVSTCAYCQPWKQYSDSAKIYNDEKNTEKAIELYTKAKEELKRDSLWSINYAYVCDSLATLYTTEGVYNDAEVLFLKAKEIKAKILGNEHVDYGTSCQDLGQLYWLRGQYEKADSLYLEARRILEQVLGRDHIMFASNCQDLAKLYVDMGRFESAESLYGASKQIVEKVFGKESGEYATNCSNLAALYRAMEQYQKAEPLYLEARNIFKTVYGKESAKYAANSISLANYYFDLGRYLEAEPLFKEAMQIYGKVLSTMHPNYAISCHNLAILYMYTGQYEKAENYYLEAMHIREKVLGKEHPDYAKSCNDLANLYSEMGQYKKSENLYITAIKIREEILGKEHPDYAESCNNLAILYSSMSQYEKAEALFLVSRKINKNLFGMDSPDYAVCCINLANLYMDLEQPKKAEPLYMQAQKILENSVGKEHPDYASCCQNIGRTYLLSKQYQKAEVWLQEAKEIREKILGKEHSDYSESCINLANLYWHLKKFDKANSFYLEAFQSQSAQVNKIFQFTSEVEKQSYVKKTVDFENYFFSFNTSVYSHSNKELSYDVSLCSRNLILYSSQQLRQAMYATTDTSVKNKYNDWINLREQLSFWYTKPVAERPDYVKDLEEQTNTLEKELTRLSSTFRTEQEQNCITRKMIQQNLKSNEAAIEFVKFNFYSGMRLTDSTYYVALLLTKNKAEPELIRLFEEKQLKNYKTIFSLYDPNNKSNTVYNLIWKPIEKHLNGIQKIYFAPAGLLYRISFPALPVNERQVLGDKYQFVQLNTTEYVVNNSKNSIDTSDKIYLYGGIQYDVDSATLKQAVVAYRGNSDENALFLPDSSRGNSWQYLPGTEKEISEIENLAKQKNYPVVFFDGVTALEESIKALNDNSSPSVLHIATHGFFFTDPKKKKKDIKNMFEAGNVFRQSDNPLFRSGLLLAGANNGWQGKQIQGVEDGILTAYEVSNLYLPNTKLAVLSACETGLGDIEEGNEGVYGLQRAFKMAGVENLVMSLWKVPDKETAEFMQEFYKNIFNKQSIDEAFYNAQTVMKNKYRTEPYKWAAWILVR